MFSPRSPWTSFPVGADFGIHEVSRFSAMSYLQNETSAQMDRGKETSSRTSLWFPSDGSPRGSQPGFLHRVLVCPESSCFVLLAKVLAQPRPNRAPTRVAIQDIPGPLKRLFFPRLSRFSGEDPKRNSTTQLWLVLRCFCVGFAAFESCVQGAASIFQGKLNKKHHCRVQVCTQ